ncbi:MAG TPA: NADH-quinone oxidoreductase subunit F, partial [Gammaproteobacteria bacterium]|nr:NADH-quinone oxidoreductase subunit F [Gammaproteobacteria bacterium]
CTPCREGTGWLYRVLKRIMDGNGKADDIDLLMGVQEKIMGNTI